MSHILHTYSPSLVSNIQRLSASMQQKELLPVTTNVSRHVIWRRKHPVMVQPEMSAALGFFGTNGPMRSRMGFSGWKTCWVRPIRCCCDERYQVSEDWTYFKRMRGEWSEGMSNFQFFLFWFARYLVVFSLTRDPIDTLESSAYIDLISVACANKHKENWHYIKRVMSRRTMCSIWRPILVCKHWHVSSTIVSGKTV